MLADITGFDWSQISVGVAAIIGLIYVVRSIRTMNSEVLTFFGNHMSTMTKALTDVASNLSTLNARVESLHEDNRDALSTLHSDNMKTADILRDATKVAGVQPDNGDGSS